MRMLIAGEWRDASDGATIDVVDPGNGESIATVPSASDADVARTIEAAQVGRRVMAAMPAHQRAAILDPYRRPDGRRARGPGTHARAGERQADPPDARGGRRGRSDHPRFRRGSEANLRSTGTDGCIAGIREPCRLHRPTAGRRGGGHRTIQLPARAVCAQGRSCPGGRQRRHRQAPQHLPTDAVAAGRHPRGGGPARRVLTR